MQALIKVFAAFVAFTTAASGLENKIASAMVDTFKAHDVKSSALILDVDKHGAQIINH